METFTFLFTDIAGSTAMLRRLGDSRYVRVLTDHHALIRSGLAAHGGKEVDTQGDAFFAVFSSPWACAATAELENLGWVRRAEGDLDGAQPVFEASLRMSRCNGQHFSTGCAILGLAADRGQWEQAAELHGLAHGFCGRSGRPWEELSVRYRRDSLAQLRAQLGEEPFKRAYSTGTILPADQPLRSALKQTPHQPDPAPVDTIVDQKGRHGTRNGPRSCQWHCEGTLDARSARAGQPGSEDHRPSPRRPWSGSSSRPPASRRRGGRRRR